MPHAFNLPAAYFWFFCLLVSLTANAQPSSPGEVNSPGFSISLSQEQQQLAGIHTQTLTLASLLPSVTAYTEVIDPQPLVENHTRIRQLVNELKAKAAIADISKARYLRLQSLGKTTQRSRMEQAKQDWLLVSNEVETLNLSIQQEKSRFLNQWGEELLHWLENKPDRLSVLEQGKIKLIKLIPAKPCPDCPMKAVIEYYQQTIPLEYVASMPSVDATLNQAGFFFIAKNAPLPFGQRLTGWLTQPQEAIIMPASAVVWKAGVPWVFVKKDEHLFQRRRLLLYRQGFENWWVIKGLESGENVVVDGAQILLSLAFREQVPEEDEDDD